MTAYHPTLGMRHGAAWMSDPAYRMAWLIGPQLAAVLAMDLLLVPAHSPEPPGKPAAWYRPAKPNQQPGTLEALRDRARTQPLAMTDLMLMATGGNAHAQFLMGTLNDPLLAHNPAPPEHGPTAAEWYGKAADHGSDMARNNLANLLIQGRFGITQDYAEARRLLGAAASGLAFAQCELGLMDLRGLGMPADQAGGMHLIRSAAERGDARAQTILGEAFDNGTDGVVKDATEAVSWLAKAAAQGNAIGERDYAVHLRDGDGVATDPARALKLFKDAAAKGDTYAQSQLTEGGNEGFARSIAMSHFITPSTEAKPTTEAASGATPSPSPAIPASPSPPQLPAAVTSAAPSGSECGFKEGPQSDGEGDVMRFLTAAEASSLLDRTQRDVRASITPEYVTGDRALLKGARGRNIVAVVPPMLTVKVGDHVAFTGGHRDLNLPCNYVPNLIRRVEPVGTRGEN